MGCTNKTSFNYNSNANTDDGSCIAKILGCTDSSATNYNPNANTDDGTCIAKILGCTDETATNYNPNANTENVPSSCIAKIYGCTDSSKFNYDSNANTENDPSSCIAKILGCTDSSATNFNPDANIDNNGCVTELPCGEDYDGKGLYWIKYYFSNTSCADVAARNKQDCNTCSSSTRDWGPGKPKCVRDACPVACGLKRSC